VYPWSIAGLCSCVIVAALGTLLLLWKKEIPLGIAVTSVGFFPLFLKFYDVYKRAQSHSLAVQMLKYIKLPEYHKHLGLIPALKKDIQILCDLRLKKNKKKLLVFVDDLDRCQPGCISKTLDAIRLVMSIPNVVVMIGIDHRIAFKAVEKTYRELEDGSRSKADIARDYLGKIIQLPVRLTAAGPEKIQNFINNKLYPNAIEVIKEIKPVPAKPVPQRPEPSPHERDEGLELPPPKPIEPGIEPKIQAPPTEKKAKIEEAMRETTDERDRFYELVKKYGFSNPRQLLRLRNCYRLLKALNRQEEYQTETLLSMLFWQEFLHLWPRKVRDGCMAAIKDKTYIEKITDRDAKEIVRVVYDDVVKLFQLKEDYSKISRFVRCVVLPHSEEGVLDTSEEIDAWLNRRNLQDK